jgi:hypothetical protein
LVIGAFEPGVEVSDQREKRYYQSNEGFLDVCVSATGDEIV